jgi:hypothetical protein
VTEPEQPPLGRVIRGGVGPGALGCRRDDVYYVAAPLRAHAWKHRAAQQERTAQVHRDDAIPVVDGQPLDGAVRSTPALLISASTRPQDATTLCTARSTDRSSRTSSAMGIAASPSVVATALAASRRTSATTTCAPAPISVRQSASPRPPAPPVTSATRPVSDRPAAAPCGDRQRLDGRHRRRVALAVSGPADRGADHERRRRRPQRRHGPAGHPVRGVLRRRHVVGARHARARGTATGVDADD